VNKYFIGQILPSWKKTSWLRLDETSEYILDVQLCSINLMDFDPLNLRLDPTQKHSK